MHLNGCHNKPRPTEQTTIKVQNGYTELKVVRIDPALAPPQALITVACYEQSPHRMSRSCMYDKNTVDKACTGCIHIGVDYD